MNYSRAFTYVFEDKNWLSKILIAGLISLIPIVGQIYLLGWMIEIIRRVKAGRTDIVPTTHFSYFLTLGLKQFVIVLIYSIPLIIVSCLFNLVSTSTKTYDGNTFTIVFSSTGFFGTLISIIVHIAVAMLSTYATIKLAETDEIRECLHFKDAYETIKNNLSLFIIVELLMFLSGIISSAGLILCFIGVIFTAPYATAVNGHLVGQLWSNLNTAGNRNRPFRGSMKDQPEDIIEEAPFTRVADIEKTIVPEAPKPVPPVEIAAEPEPETAAETVVEEATETAESAAETAAETAESVIEEAEHIVSEAADSAEEAAPSDEEKPEDDMPAFE